MTLGIVEFDRFDAAREDWNELLGRGATGQTIFSTWDWQHLWWQAFGGASALRLIVVRDDDSPIGIWPLMQADQALALLGGAEVCDYLDVIALMGREQEVLAAGMEFLGDTTPSKIDLRFVPMASPTLELLPGIARRLGWTVESEVDEVCPAIVLPADWESYLGSLEKKDRHELRRKLRRLGEAGELRWEVTSGPEELHQDTTDFVRLHRLSGVEKASFMDDAMEDFFRVVIARFRPSGQLKLYFLNINDMRVATTLCLEHNDELWIYNSGFDREYAAYSVGLAMKAYCVQHAIASGKRKVDFLRGREAYKYDLGASDYPVYRLRLALG